MRVLKLSKGLTELVPIKISKLDSGDKGCEIFPVSLSQRVFAHGSRDMENVSEEATSGLKWFKNLPLV